MCRKFSLFSFISLILIISFISFCFSCKQKSDQEHWLDSLHEQGRKVFSETIAEEIDIHPKKAQLQPDEIQKIEESETRYERLFELLVNIFYLKEEPVFQALLEDGKEISRFQFEKKYLDLVRFSAHNFVECFFYTDASTDYVKNLYSESKYKDMDAVDLVIRSIGYHAKLDIPERKMFANALSPEYEKQGALYAASFPKAHKITKGKGAKIAILDTGIDDSHSVFKNTPWGRHVSLVGRVGKPWETKAPIIDWGGHGTLISSVATVYAPEAQITMYKFGDGNTQNDPVYQHLMQCIIAAAIYKAVHDGNDIISISASGASHGPDYLKEACQYAYNNNRVIICGNLYNRWKRTGNNLNFPSHYDTVMSVTAAEKRPDGSYGHWDICAPEVRTTIAAPHDIFGAFPTYMEEEDTYIPSISAAIPTVAALTALVVSVYPRLGTEAPGEYCEIIKKLIIQNANPEAVGFQDFSPECGYGLIDAEKTVKEAVLLNKKRLAVEINQ